MQDLEQFSYWQEKPLTSSHCYDIYNLVISVELKELADRVVANNDLVEEIQLDLCIQQLRVPAWHESWLMSMGDALLRALQRWILDYKYGVWSPYGHGRICREQEINLQLHLQHLSESDDFQEEKQFVESRPIERGEHKVCHCGQAPIESYSFLENKCL